jgi:predicted solute-binding protein
MANKYFRQAFIPSAATETTIYTVPSASTGIARSLRITNANAARTTLTVTQYSAAVAHYLLKSYTLAPNGTVDVFNGVPCVLEGDDILKVTSSAATVHFYLSYLEMDRS